MDINREIESLRIQLEAHRVVLAVLLLLQPQLPARSLFEQLAIREGVKLLNAGTADLNAESVEAVVADLLSYAEQIRDAATDTQAGQTPSR